MGRVTVATTDEVLQDGVHALPPRERMSAPARMLRDCCAVTPRAPIIQREFGLMEGTLDRWKSEGMPDEWPFPDDPPAVQSCISRADARGSCRSATRTSASG